jgi:formamidopyrimidine-DNA glycosylase
MPELPEVEVLVRCLRPRVVGQTIRGVSVRRLRVIAPTTEKELAKALKGARFMNLARRAKYLVFTLGRGRTTFTLLGHLGMSGDMFVVPQNEPEPKHAAVVLSLGKEKFIYEDTRYFGRMTLDTTPLEYLGPEPLGKEFRLDAFAGALQKSSQPIKVKLLDQCLVAGLGNIYASEALFRAGVDPRLPARKLNAAEVSRLWKAIPQVLAEAIRFGATRGDTYIGRLAVYDRAGKPCLVCKSPIRRIVQAARSTYFCPKCQRRH